MGTSQEKIGLRQPKSNVIVWKLFPLTQILFFHSDNFATCVASVFCSYKLEWRTITLHLSKEGSRMEHLLSSLLNGNLTT
jgi:hypothetical protein